jgi:hypothetical protein
MTAMPPAFYSHLTIEAHLADLLARLDDGRGGEVADLWSGFESALLRHFDEEEHTVLVDLLASRPREARALLEEHRYLRARLAELAAALPGLPAEAARTFFDELCAHGRHEDRLISQWSHPRTPSSA